MFTGNILRNGQYKGWGVIGDDEQREFYEIHCLHNSLCNYTWDLVSAGTGQYAKRYGFIYVDRHDDGTGDFSRSKKDSFYWYKKVIESQGEDLD